MSSGSSVSDVTASLYQIARTYLTTDTFTHTFMIIIKVKLEALEMHLLVLHVLYEQW